MTGERPVTVIVLAAGAGTRMRSRTSKLLHEIGGRTLIGHALAAARALIDTDTSAEEIASKAMEIAADICIYTNHNIIVESLDAQ